MSSPMPKRSQGNLDLISVSEQGVVPCQTYLAHSCRTNGIYNGEREGIPLSGMCHNPEYNHTILLEHKSIKIYSGSGEDMCYLRTMQLNCECSATYNGIHYSQSHRVYLILQRGQRHAMPLLQIVSHDFEHSFAIQLTANHISNSAVTWSVFEESRSELVVGFRNGEILSWQIRRYSNKTLDFRIPLRVRFSSINRVLPKELCRIVSDLQIISVEPGVGSKVGKSESAKQESRLLLASVGFYLFVWNFETGRMLAGWDLLSQLPELLPPSPDEEIAPVGVVHLAVMPSAKAVFVTVGGTAGMFVFRFDPLVPHTARFLNTISTTYPVVSMYTLNSTMWSNVIATVESDSTFRLWSVNDSEAVCISTSRTPTLTSASAGIRIKTSPRKVPQCSSLVPSDIKTTKASLGKNKEDASVTEEQDSVPVHIENDNFDYDRRNRYFACFFVNNKRSIPVVLLGATTWVMQLDILSHHIAVGATWSRSVIPDPDMVAPPPCTWVTTIGNKRRKEFRVELHGMNSMVFLSCCLGIPVPSQFFERNANTHSVGAAKQFVKTTVTVFQMSGRNSDCLFVLIVNALGETVATARLPNHAKRVQMDIAKWAPSVEVDQLPAPVLISSIGATVIARNATLVIGWEDGRVDTVSISGIASATSHSECTQRVHSHTQSKVPSTCFATIPMHNDEQSVLVLIGRKDGTIDTWEVSQFESHGLHNTQTHAKGTPIVNIHVLPNHDLNSNHQGQINDAHRVAIVGLDGQIKVYSLTGTEPAQNRQLLLDSYFRVGSHHNENSVPQLYGSHFVSASKLIGGLKQTTLAVATCNGDLQLWPIPQPIPPPNNAGAVGGRKRRSGGHTEIQKARISIVREPISSISNEHASPIICISNCESDRYNEFVASKRQQRFYTVFLATTSIDSTAILWDCGGRTAASTKLSPLMRFQFNMVPRAISFAPLLCRNKSKARPIELLVSFGTNHGEFVVDWKALEASKGVPRMTLKCDVLRKRPPSSSGTKADRKALTSYYRYYDRSEPPRTAIITLETQSPYGLHIPDIESIRNTFIQTSTSYDQVRLNCSEVGSPTPLAQLLSGDDESDNDETDEASEKLLSELLAMKNNGPSVVEEAMRLCCEGELAVVHTSSLEGTRVATVPVVQSTSQVVQKGNKTEKQCDEAAHQGNNTQLTLPRPWSSTSGQVTGVKEALMVEENHEDPFQLQGMEILETSVTEGKHGSRVQLRSKIANIEGNTNSIVELDEKYFASVTQDPVSANSPSRPIPSTNPNNTLASPTRVQFHSDTGFGPLSSGIQFALPIGFSDRLHYEKILLKGRKQKRKLNTGQSPGDQSDLENELETRMKKSMWRLRRKLQTPSKSGQSKRGSRSGYKSDSSLYSGSQFTYSSFDDSDGTWGSSYSSSFYSSDSSSFDTCDTGSDESERNSMNSLSDSETIRGPVSEARRKAREKRSLERKARRRTRRRKHRNNHHTTSSGDEQASSDTEVFDGSNSDCPQEVETRRTTRNSRRTKSRRQRRQRKVGGVQCEDGVDVDPEEQQYQRRRKTRSSRNSKRHRSKSNMHRSRSRRSTKTKQSDLSDSDDIECDETRKQLSRHRTRKNWSEVWFLAASIIAEELEQFETKPRTRRRGVPLSRADQWHRSYKVKKRLNRTAKKLKDDPLNGFELGGKSIFAKPELGNAESQKQLMDHVRRTQIGGSVRSYDLSCDHSRPSSAFSRSSHTTGYDDTGTSDSTVRPESGKQSRRSIRGSISRRQSRIKSSRGSFRKKSFRRSRINLDEVLSWFSDEQLQEDDEALKAAERNAQAAVELARQELDDKRWFALNEHEPSPYDQSSEVLQAQVVLAMSHFKIWQVAKAAGLLRPTPRDHLLTDNPRVVENLNECVRWWLRESTKELRSVYYTNEAKSALSNTTIKRSLYNLTGRAYSNIDPMDASSRIRRKRQLWRDFRVDYYSTVFDSRRTNFVLKERDRLSYEWLEPTLQWKIWLRADVKQRPERYDGIIDPRTLDRYKRVIIRKEMECEREEMLSREKEDYNQSDPEQTFSWNRTNSSTSSIAKNNDVSLTQNTEMVWDDSIQLALTTMSETIWPTGYSRVQDAENLQLAEQVENDDHSKWNTQSQIEFTDDDDDGESDIGNHHESMSIVSSSDEGETEEHVEHRKPIRQSQAFVRKQVDPSEIDFFQSLLNFEFELVAFRPLPNELLKYHRFLEEWGSECGWLTMTPEQQRLELEAASCDRIVRNQASACLIQVPSLVTEVDVSENHIASLGENERLRVAENTARATKRDERCWAIFGLWYAGNTVVREGFFVRELKAAIGDQSILQQAIRQKTFDEEAISDGIQLPQPGVLQGEDIETFETWAVAKWMNQYVKFHTSPEATESFGPIHKRRVSQMLVGDVRRVSERVHKVRSANSMLEQQAEQIFLDVRAWQSKQEVNRYVQKGDVLTHTEVEQVRERRRTRLSSVLGFQIQQQQEHQLNQVINNLEPRKVEYDEAVKLLRRTLIYFKQALELADTDEQALRTHEEESVQKLKNQLEESTESELNRLNWEEVRELEVLDHDLEDAMEQAKESHEEAQFEAQVMFDMKANKAGTKTMLMAATKRGKAELIAAERRQKEEEAARMTYEQVRAQVAAKYDRERKALTKSFDDAIADGEAKMAKSLFECTQAKAELYTLCKQLCEQMVKCTLLLKKKYDESVELKQLHENGVKVAEVLELRSEWIVDQDQVQLSEILLNTVDENGELQSEEVVEVHLARHEVCTPIKHWDDMQSRISRSMFLDAITTFVGSLSKPNEAENNRMYAMYGRSSASVQYRKLKEFQGKHPIEFLRENITKENIETYLAAGKVTFLPLEDEECQVRDGMKILLSEPEKKHEDGPNDNETDIACENFKKWYLNATTKIRNRFLTARVNRYKEFQREMILRGDQNSVDDACLFDTDALVIPPEDEAVRRRKYYKQVMGWYTLEQLYEDDIRMQRAERRGRKYQKRELEESFQRELYMMREHLRAQLEGDDEVVDVSEVWQEDTIDKRDQDTEPIRTMVFVKGVRKTSIDFIKKIGWENGDGTLNNDEAIDAELLAEEEAKRFRDQTEKEIERELKLMKREEDLMKRWLVEQRRIRLNAEFAKEMNEKVYQLREEERQRREDPGGMTIEQRRQWELQTMADEEGATRIYLQQLVELAQDQKREANELLCMEREDTNSLVMMQRARDHAQLVQERLERQRFRELELMSFQDECSAWMSKKWENQRRLKLAKRFEVKSLEKIAFVPFTPVCAETDDDNEAVLLTHDGPPEPTPQPFAFTRSFVTNPKDDSVATPRSLYKITNTETVLPKALQYEIHLSKQFQKSLQIPRADFSYSRKHHTESPMHSARLTSRSRNSKANHKVVPSSKGNTDLVALSEDIPVEVIERSDPPPSAVFKLQPLKLPKSKKGTRVESTFNYPKSSMIDIGVNGQRRPMRPTSSEKKLKPVARFKVQNQGE